MHCAMQWHLKINVQSLVIAAQIAVKDSPLAYVREATHKELRTGSIYGRTDFVPGGWDGMEAGVGMTSDCY